MMRYLIDSSGLWRILRDEALRLAWSEAILARAVASCNPQRTEFRRSARNLDEYEQMTEMFHDLYPDAPVPKTAWTWVESAQYRLIRHGAHRAMSVADMLIAATAAHHGLTVLHDDNDFVVAARHMSDVAQRPVLDAPDADAS
jgi:predicted nucleic acid-binding protein